MISDATLLSWMKADSADTATLRILEKAAIKAIQKQTGRYLGVTAAQTEIIRFTSWPIALSNEPIGGVLTSLEQWNGTAYQVVSSADYTVIGSLVWPNSTFTNPVTQTFLSTTQRYRAIYQAGYTVDGSDANVWAAPEDIQQAVLLLVGHWFENRESVVIGTTSAEVQQSLNWLLDAQRRATV